MGMFWPSSRPLEAVRHCQFRTAPQVRAFDLSATSPNPVEFFEGGK